MTHQDKLSLVWLEKVIATPPTGYHAKKYQIKAQNLNHN